MQKKKEERKGAEECSWHIPKMLLFLGKQNDNQDLLKTEETNKTHVKHNNKNLIYSWRPSI